MADTAPNTQPTQPTNPSPKKFFRGWRWILMLPLGLCGIVVLKIVITFVLEQLADAMPI